MWRGVRARRHVRHLRTSRQRAARRIQRRVRIHLWRRRLRLARHMGNIIRRNVSYSFCFWAWRDLARTQIAARGGISGRKLADFVFQSSTRRHAFDAWRRGAAALVEWRGHARRRRAMERLRRIVHAWRDVATAATTARTARAGMLLLLSPIDARNSSLGHRHRQAADNRRWRATAHITFGAWHKAASHQAATRNPARRKARRLYKSAIERFYMRRWQQCAQAAAARWAKGALIRRRIHLRLLAVVVPAWRVAARASAEHWARYTASATRSAELRRRRAVRRWKKWARNEEAWCVFAADRTVRIRQGVLRRALRAWRRQRVIEVRVAAAAERAAWRAWRDKFARWREFAERSVHARRTDAANCIQRAWRSRGNRDTMLRALRVMARRPHHARRRGAGRARREARRVRVRPYSHALLV